jgi:putative PIN family toxin of toxin-antitoxin system
MIRVVFDTNVLFSAVFKSVGLQAVVFNLVIAGKVLPCVSDAVLAEYNDVLNRPVLQPHAQRAREVLALLDRVAVHVKPAVTVTACSDPDDDCFLECAEAAGADYLVTGNTRHFPQQHKTTKIVTGRQLLKLLGEAQT